MWLIILIFNFILIDIFLVLIYHSKKKICKDSDVETKSMFKVKLYRIKIRLNMIKEKIRNIYSN